MIKMKLTQLFKQKKAVYSFEVFPPKKGGAITAIDETLEQLCQLKPDFISVTYGAGGNRADHSTCEIASKVKQHYGVEALAHLTCVNSDKAQVLETLALLKAKGVENILALRGDLNPDAPRPSDFHYAQDLIRVIQENGDFHIAAACYPEGHAECDTMQRDLEHLKWKVEAGASHLITQLFFDNADFYRFRENAYKMGITVPIEAGIMPVVNKKQIQRMVSMCGASLPKALVKLINRYEFDREALRDAGIAYAAKQIIDLLSNSADGIHLYTMNDVDVARRITQSISHVLACESRKKDA